MAIKSLTKDKLDELARTMNDAYESTVPGLFPVVTLHVYEVRALIAAARKLRRIETPRKNRKHSPVKSRARNLRLEKQCVLCGRWCDALNDFTTHPKGVLGRDNRCNLCRAGVR